MKTNSEMFGTDQPVALVTGSGSRRVGNAIVRRLADRGFRVAVHCRTSRDEADRTADEINRSGGKAFVVQGAVERESDVADIFAEIDNQCGRIDVAVNSAAITVNRPKRAISARLRAARSRPAPDLTCAG